MSDKAITKMAKEGQLKALMDALYKQIEQAAHRAAANGSGGMDVDYEGIIKAKLTAAEKAAETRAEKKRKELDEGKKLLASNTGRSVRASTLKAREEMKRKIEEELRKSKARIAAIGEKARKHFAEKIQKKAHKNEILTKVAAAEKKREAEEEAAEKAERDEEAENERVKRHGAHNHAKTRKNTSPNRANQGNTGLEAAMARLSLKNHNKPAASVSRRMTSAERRARRAAGEGSRSRSRSGSNSPKGSRNPFA